jgi:hypothetical protein
MRIRTVLFAILALFVASLASHAGVVYTVSLDTSALVGFGPFGLAFQFVDASGNFVSDANNNVTVSNFQFGGGSPSGSPAILSTVGFVSGSLDSGTVSMIDDQPFGYFAQMFTPGTTLSFRLESTTNPDAGGAYDLFTFGITDSGFFPIATTAGDGSALLSLTLDDPVNPTLLTYRTDYPDNAAFALGPPVVTGAGEVPEPATWLPVGLLMGGAWCRRRWRARR